MYACFENCFLAKLGHVLFAATIFAIIAGIAAAAGGLTVVLAGVTLGVVSCAILAALAVFGVIVAGAALACFIGCAMEAQPGPYEPDPPRDPADLTTPPRERETPGWFKPIADGLRRIFLGR